MRSGYTWVFLFGLVLRGLYLLQASQANEVLTTPHVDARSYMDATRAILAGRWLGMDELNITPIFPIWLTVCICLLGFDPIVHFAFFHLLGALQAVIVGKTAETIWNRKVGVTTGFIAAGYWPLIIFEASYHIESFAILLFAAGLFLIVRWDRTGRRLRTIIWAGTLFGCLLLARANTLICLGAITLWMAWRIFRENGRGSFGKMAANAAAFLIPVLMLSAPVLIWRWHESGAFMLRSGGWLDLHLGNAPSHRALVAPVGVRWNDHVYEPVRAGAGGPAEQEEFWKKKLIDVVREHPGDWLQLMGRKAVMLLNQFEVSQEIDIQTYRQGSSILSCPVWPGWGFLFPLVGVAILGMRSAEGRKGFILLFTAVAYMASIAIVHVAGRYRLPVVIPLFPLAGWALVAFSDAIARRQFRACLEMVAIAGLAGLLSWPDWAHLRNEKLVNYFFFLGITRIERGDPEGAFEAFRRGAEWNPEDPDCPLRMGRMLFERGDYPAAAAMFKRSYEIFPSYEAVLGSGECAFAQKEYGRAMDLAGEVLRIAPNNLEALDLAVRLFSVNRDWGSVLRTCELMRSSYRFHPASIEFTEAWALIQAGQMSDAVSCYDRIAATPRYAALERARATFMAGAVLLTQLGDKQNALFRWQQLDREPHTFFSMLASVLCRGLDPDPMQSDAGERSKLYIQSALAMRASMKGDESAARNHWREVLSIGKAANLTEGPLEVLASRSLGE